MKDKLAIFDLDGTLFDTREVNFSSYRQALMEEGVMLDRDFYEKMCNGKFYKDYLPFLMNHPSEEQMERVHERKKQLYPSCLNAAKENKHLFSILSMIEDKYYTALVTTASRANCEDILRYFHRENDFNLILTHDDVTKKKPDPQGFKLAMKHFNICAEDTVIFEDSDVGIEAAKRSGASVIRIMDFL